MNTSIDMKGRDANGRRSVIGSAIAIFMTGAMVFGYSGVVGGYWKENYGASAASLTLTFLLIALGMGMFCAGKLHMRIGTRASFFLGIACEVLAILALIFGHSKYTCWLFGFLTGWNASFIYSPGLTNVQNWFPQKRGLVSGIVNLIFGISAAILSPFMNRMLDSTGYITMNWILLGLVVVLTGVGALMAEMPNKAKMTDEQRAAHRKLLADIEAQRAAGGGKGPARSYTVKEALKTKAFWAIWFVWLFMGSAGINMVSLSKSYSLHLEIAGVAALTSFNITNGVSRIIAGSISDKIGRRGMGTVGFIIGAIGYAGLIFSHTLLPFCIFAMCVGFAFGTLFAISAPLATDLFGLENFGMIFGLIFTAYGFVGGICGPLLSDVILNATGSYTPVFAYLCVFCILSAIIILFAKHRKSALPAPLFPHKGKNYFR